MMDVNCKFFVGQLIHHRLFNYRGVVVDVDPDFQGTAEWYDAVARSQPPKDEPWYHILVDGREEMTYVAEQNLEEDDSQASIRHPLISHFFTQFDQGKYERMMS